MRHALRLLAVLVLAVLCLQLWFAARILLMRFVAPQSTSFQRSEIVRLMTEKHQVAWAQAWVDDAQLARPGPGQGDGQGGGRLDDHAAACQEPVPVR
jgi:monofunctional biosynthetic peptidoglycan transglycosylase